MNPGKERNYRVVGSPVAVAGMVYATSRRNPVLAFRAGGTGDISTESLGVEVDGSGRTRRAFGCYRW